MITLSGKCDQTRYKVDTNNRVIKSVSYKDSGGGKVFVKDRILVMPNSNLMQIGEPPDISPDSVVAAFWYARAAYEFIKKPVWFFYEKESTLVVFPPPLSDGDYIVIDFNEEPVED